MTQARHAWRVWLLCALVSALASACGSKTPKLAKAPPPRSVAPRPSLQRGAITMHGLTAVHSRALGPLIARRMEGTTVRASVAAWITAGGGTSRRLLLQPLDARSAPVGRMLALADVPLQSSRLVVGPSGGVAGGFVLTWTSLTDRGKALWALSVRDDGMPRARPVEIARTDDDIVWMELLPTPEGTLCLWAEDTRESDATIVAALIQPDGRVKGTPTRIAHGVTNWRIVTGAERALVVARDAAPPPAKVKGNKKRPPRTDQAAEKELSLLRLDAAGGPHGTPVVLAPRTQVWGDIDAVEAREGVVVAWTDRVHDEPRVSAARVGAGDKVAQAPLIEARGGARLVAIATGGAGTAVLWDTPRGRDPIRLVHVARVNVGADPPALEGRTAALHVGSHARPELVATPNGFAVMAAMAACSPDPVEKGEPCKPIIAPTLVRLDAHAVAVQTEVLSLADRVATSAWGLSCPTEACHALAADGDTPTKVSSLEVASRQNLPTPPAPVAPPEDAPRVTDAKTIVQNESVSAIGSARFGDALLVATLGTPTDGSKPGAARLSTRIVRPDGSTSTPIVLSTRALPIGGLAIAAAEGTDKGGAIAWVARENGNPEVHVTRLDKSGKRTNDIQLTTTKGDASDVALVWSGNGFVVAWVDGRHGNGEVFATRVSPQLERTAREERLTKSPGDASDLVALAQGNKVWLAWADPRESARDGRSDIYVTAVRQKDAKVETPEVRLAATAAHSRTPRLAADADGVRVAWIEEAPAGAASPSAAGYGAMHVHLDAQGKARAAPKRLPTAGEGAASSVALEPFASGLRAIIARAGRDHVTLDAATLDGATERVTPLLSLSGPPSMDVVLHLRDGVLYFNDDGPSNTDKRARRAAVDWRR